MKIPLKPPIYGNNDDTLALAMQAVQPGFDFVIPEEYLHWDQVRHKPPPPGWTLKAWWYKIKYARHYYNVIPFTNTNHKPFLLTLPNALLQKLSTLDRYAGNAFPSTVPIINSQLRDTYVVRSLMEEAITSSQLEGASTTRRVAKEMLQSQRKPRDLSEQMIFNNYNAMLFIREHKKDALSPELILELHEILTDRTLDNPADAGKLRTIDDIYVWDNENHILHTPPKATELSTRLEKLCQFANMPVEQNKFFLHPVVKAILLHFMLAYDHPFVDGNGRTARALFYWSMANQGYWLMEFISISEILKKAHTAYFRAFLYTETDESDVTYFIIHQLNVILAAIKALHTYMDNQVRELEETEQLIHADSLRGQLNHRQVYLLKHALKHPHMIYEIKTHQQLNQLAYETARTDLLNLEKLGLLLKNKVGKEFTFTVPADLKKKIAQIS